MWFLKSKSTRLKLVSLTFRFETLETARADRCPNDGHTWLGDYEPPSECYEVCLTAGGSLGHHRAWGYPFNRRNARIAGKVDVPSDEGSVRKKVDLVFLHRPSACFPPLLHPTCQRMGNPSRVARKSVRQDQQAPMRTA